MIKIQYLHHVQLNTKGSKLGYYNLLPLTISFPLVLYKLKQNATLAPPSMLCKIEQKGMFQSHGILHLPCSLFRIVVLPLHLYLSNDSILEHCDLPVEDAQWLGLELSLRLHLTHILINHMVRIMYIFLKKSKMKNIMIPSASKKCNSICSWPYSFKQFK